MGARIRLYEGREVVMTSKQNGPSRGALTLLLGVVLMLTVGVWTGLAQEHGEAGEGVSAEHAAENGGGLAGGVAIGAGLAIGLTALATGMAQARIGAAGIGAVAEDPKRLGMVIMLVAMPETVAILGFVIAYLIIS